MPNEIEDAAHLTAGRVLRQRVQRKYQCRARRRAPSFILRIALLRVAGRISGFCCVVGEAAWSEVAVEPGMLLGEV